MTVLISSLRSLSSIVILNESRRQIIEKLGLDISFFMSVSYIEKWYRTRYDLD